MSPLEGGSVTGRQSTVRAGCNGGNHKYLKVLYFFPIWVIL